MLNENNVTILTRRSNDLVSEVSLQEYLKALEKRALREASDGQAKHLKVRQICH